MKFTGEKLLPVNSSLKNMANTLIVFASNYGTVEKSVRQLFNLLDGNVDICNLDKRESFPDLNNYDTVIIGGSIHFGNIQKVIANYCNENKAELLDKRLGLFINCLYSGEKAKKQLDDAFPEELNNCAISRDFFGGELFESKLKFWEKAVTSIVIKSGLVGDIMISEVKIEKFAHEMNTANGPEN